LDFFILIFSEKQEKMRHKFSCAHFHVFHVPNILFLLRLLLLVPLVDGVHPVNPAVVPFVQQQVVVVEHQHKVELVVGQLFTLNLTTTASMATTATSELNKNGGNVAVPVVPNPAHFPRWCRFNQSNGEIYGIPQFPDDVGEHSIRLNNSNGFFLDLFFNTLTHFY
jgi:hypothetical protein